MQEQFLDPIRFELEFPSVFKRFTEWGFIIEDGINEFDIIKFRDHDCVFNNRDYHFIISLTDADEISFKLTDEYN